ncbi:hypothetical protein ACFL5F_07850 [Planctomycetota bacterium]
MELWTLQTPNHDLTSGRVDHSQSEYYNTVSGIKEAYCELWQRLKILDGQIIWCYTNKSDIVTTPTDNMVLWELHIEPDDILCLIDTIVWNRILGKRCSVSKTIRTQWISEGLKRCPDDPVAGYHKIEEEFWNQKPLSGSWWNDLFVENLGKHIDAIIRHPVLEDNVIGKITLRSN